MGRITVQIKLNQFYIRKQNDKGGKDEPYLLTLFARLDSDLQDPNVEATKKILPIHFPEGLGHGDLGPDSKGMSLTGRSIVKVPAKIGEWTTTLNSEFLDFTPVLMRNCAAAVGVVFLEEDSTLDSTINAVLPAIKKEIRRRANTFLRFLIGVMPDLPSSLPNREQILQQLQERRQQLLEGEISPNRLVSGQGFMDYLIAVALPGEIGKAIGKYHVLGNELATIIASIVQATDADEFIGANGAIFPFYDFVGRAHAPSKFQFDTVTFSELRLPGVEPIRFEETSKGIYAVDGTVRRVDTDEPPIVAAVRGPGERVTVFGRRLDADNFERNHSDDFGKTYKVENVGNFAAGRFKSGPAAASALDGKIQCVAGLGLDNEIWFAISTNNGSNWVAWNRISKRKTFKSAPAVALSNDGVHLYVVGRDDENFYWFNKSADRGESWGSWERIGRGVFHSSPAMVSVKSPRGAAAVLVVAGLGTDKRVWTARFQDSESLANQDWSPIRAGEKDSPTGGFTSAPAMASDGNQKILLVCRAADLLYRSVESFDGGREFQVGTVWHLLGKSNSGAVRYPDGKRSGDLQDMYSAPAVVVSNDMETRLVIGLSPTLGLWRNRYRRHEQATWHPITKEPEQPTRMHYY